VTFSIGTFMRRVPAPYRGAGTRSVHVETDEDVEIRLPDRHMYVQVKMRGEPLERPWS
jgi:hypothetical protein